MTDLLVIGVGNRHRGDDGAGLLAARLVHDALPTVDTRESGGDAAELIDLWGTTRAHVVYVIDAMVSGAAPGTIARFDAHRHPLPAEFSGVSTHKFGVTQAIELARVLDCLPSQMIVYGIEGSCFEVGGDITREVEAAACVVAQRIGEEILSKLPKPQAT